MGGGHWPIATPPSLSLAGHCEPIVHSCPPFSCPASSAAILVACGMQRVRVPGEAVELDQPADRSIAVLLLPCLSTSCNPFGFVLDRGMRVVRPARTCRAFLIRCHPGRARRSSDREVAGCARPCLCAKRSAPAACVRVLRAVACALFALGSLAFYLIALALSSPPLPLDRGWESLAPPAAGLAGPGRLLGHKTSHLIGCSWCSADLQGTGLGSPPRSGPEMATVVPALST